jgi:hypothetical protein
MWRHVEQTRQVGVTYVTHRWAALITLVALVLVIVPNLIAAISRRGPAEGAPAYGFLVGFPALFVTMFLVLHAKAQFANPRARLMPGFAGPHLAALGGAVLGLVVLYPLVIAWCTRIDPLGIVALTLAIAAPYAWAAHANRMAWMLVPLAVFYSLMTERGVRWWIVDAPTHRLLNLIIIAGGGALLAAWVWRLTRLHEEADDYRTPMSWPASRKAGTEVPEQRRLIAEQVRRNRLMSWIGDTWHARLGGYHGHRRMRLARLLRYGFGSIPAELHAMSLLLIAIAPALLVTQLGYISDESSPVPGVLLITAQFAILMPGMVVGQLLARRRPRLAGELLLPISRREWADGLLVASASNALVWWLTFNAGLILMVWPILGNRITPAIVAMFLLLSAAIALVLFGIALRTAFWNSLALRLGVIIVAFIALMAPLAVWYGLHDRYGDWPFVAISLALGALGAGLVAGARRAWLNLELG